MATEETGEIIKNALRRVTRSNFQREKATDAEREILAAAKRPVKDPLAQDYAAWRRAAALIGCVALIIWGVIELATYEETADKMRAMATAQAKKLPDEQGQRLIRHTGQRIRAFGTDNLELIDTVKMMISLSIIIGAVFLVMAARSWHNVRLSRRQARIAFYIVFLTPFVLAAIPFTALMDFGHLEKSARKGVTILLGLDLGFYLFMLVGPRALALFPGVIRSSITLKTLIPESPLAGWGATLMSAFYPIFLIVIIAFLNQVTGNVTLLAGIICLIVAPVIYIRNAKAIMRPHSAEDVEKFVVRIRTKVMVFNLAGFALLAIFIFDLDLFTPMDAARFIASFLGNFMLVTLVASDLILALLRAGHEQTMAFKGTSLSKELDRKFAGLAGVGLTDIKVSKEEASGDADDAS